MEQERQLNGRMDMHKVAVLIVLAALTLPEPAAAGDPFSYNQLDLDGGSGLLNSGDTYGGRGWNAAASVEIAPHVFAFGSLNGIRHSEMHLDDDAFSDFLHGYFSDEDADPLEHARDDDSEHVQKRGNELGLGLNWSLDRRHDVFLGLSRMHQRLQREEDLGDGIPHIDIRGNGPNLRFGLRGAYRAGPRLKVNVSVAANYGWLDSDIASTGPYSFSIPAYSERSLKVLGVTAGVGLQPTRHFGFGWKLSAVHFAGDTDLRMFFGVRLHLEDWDGPPD
jgi:hypothetical protein